MALLDDIEVKESEWIKGYGNSGMTKFLKDAVSKGACRGFLRVGYWNSEQTDYKTMKEKNLHFYRKAGWILLRNPERIVAPFMCHTLGST